MSVWDPMFRNKDGKGMPITFRWRSLLRDALEDLKNSRDPGARLFSYEWNRLEPRLRRYCVMNKDDMFVTMNTGNECHFFEMITDTNPIKPFFDLEFPRAANPNLDPDVILEIFITMVLLTFKNIYGIKFNRSDILILNSSSIDKASFHLICIIPGGRCFFRNRDMKDFLKNLTRGFHPMNPQITGLVRDLVVNKNDGGKMFVFDPSVYGSNQNFRLYANSKLGKKERLFLYHTCDFYFSRGLEAFEPAVFEDSLVSIIEEKLPAQFIKETVTLQTSMSLLDEKNIQVSSDSNVPVPKTISEPMKLSSASVRMEEQLIRSDKGPYPQLWDFFDEKVKKYKANCKVYGYHGTYSDVILRYHVMYPMMCEFSHKQHKSNGVWYVVDTLNRKYWQRCHDQDCRAKRKEKPTQYPLPAHLFRNSNDGDSDKGNGDLDPSGSQSMAVNPSASSVQYSGDEPAMSDVQQRRSIGEQQRQLVGPSTEVMYTQQEALDFLCGKEEASVLNEDQNMEDNNESREQYVEKPEEPSNDVSFKDVDQRDYANEEVISFEVPVGYELVKKKSSGRPDEKSQTGCGTSNLKRGQSGRQQTEDIVRQSGTVGRGTVALLKSNGQELSESPIFPKSKNTGQNFVSGLCSVDQQRRGFETPTKQIKLDTTGQRTKSFSYMDFRSSSHTSSEVTDQSKKIDVRKEGFTVVKKLDLEKEDIRSVLSEEDVQVLQSYDWSKLDQEDEEEDGPSSSNITVRGYDNLAARREREHNAQTTEQARKVIYIVRTEVTGQKRQKKQPDQM